jgi:YHS domain-containing protein
MERYIVSVKGKSYYFSDKASADSFAAYCNDIYHTDLIWAVRAK